MSKRWGLRTWDPITKKLTFDSLSDETMFFHDEIVRSEPYNYPNRYPNIVKGYPELVGGRIYVFQVYVSHLENSATVDISGTLSVTYPNNVPTVSLIFQPNETAFGGAITRRILVLSDGGGSSAAVGGRRWGVTMLNEGRRVTISDRADAYVFLGKFAIPVAQPSITAVSSTTITCVGTPIIFMELTNIGSHFVWVYPLGNDRWRLFFWGQPNRVNHFRVFGRVSLNRPNGSGVRWGARIKNKATNRVTFDSGLKMLALKGYTAATLPTLTRSAQTINLGFSVENTSFSSTLANNRAWVRSEKWQQTEPGWAYFRDSYQNFAYLLTSGGSASQVRWQEYLINTFESMRLSPDDVPDVQVLETKTPYLVEFKLPIYFIDNNRYEQGQSLSR